MLTTWSYASTRTLRVALVATLAALAAVALVTLSQAARAADGDCQPSGNNTVCTFAVGTSTWTVPNGVKQATFDVLGAQGGNGGSPGGLGGAATATFTNLQPGSQLQVNVGAPGANNGLGGAIGGGNGGVNGGAGGGGASDVRVGGSALGDRIIVAAGGGGGGGNTSGCIFGSDTGGRGGAGGGIDGTGGFDGAGAGTGGGGGGGASTGPGSGNGGGTGGRGSGSDSYTTVGENGFLGGGGRGGIASSCGGGGGGGGGGYYGGGGGGAGSSDPVSPGGGGGGGGGSSYVSADGSTAEQLQAGVRSGAGQVTITYTTPDTTAPTVISTFPDANDPNATMGKSDLVTATFSEAVRNVTASTFYLKKYTIDRRGKETYVPVTAKVTSPNDHTAVLRPTKDLQQGTYQATIKDVTDLAGNALVPKTWSFKVTR